MGGLSNGSLDSPMTDVFSHASKRSRLTPPLSERLMLFVKQDQEEYFTPLHLVPPGTVGLLAAVGRRDHTRLGQIVKEKLKVVGSPRNSGKIWRNTFKKS